MGIVASSSVCVLTDRNAIKQKWSVRTQTMVIENNRNKDFQFWKQDNHPIELDHAQILDSKMDYLHQNPVRAPNCP
ncbi:MAG: hypothetical protein IE931_12510 [Sphingobacteriales bacterium]|nr:hypothetical protein [Sphingobacteriales bacterium]